MKGHRFFKKMTKIFLETDIKTWAYLYNILPLELEDITNYKSRQARLKIVKIPNIRRYHYMGAFMLKYF